jgi:hypothetical protein
MRSAVGIFGVACGLIVIGLVGRYGFKSTDIEADAWIMGFLFGAIAAGGLFGHAVAVRLWRTSQAASVAVGIVSAVALLLNLSNSLGAIAGRADTVTMERITKNRSIRAAEAELKRLTDLRMAIPAFVQTDADAVSAAKRAADAATTAKERECGAGDPKQRGRFCRDKEDAEKAATETLTQVSAAKATTDRATKLENDAQKQRDKLAELGPLVIVNVQGSAIAKLFRLPDEEADFAATAQQFGVAVVVELIIVMCMIAWEVLGYALPTPARPEDVASNAAVASLEVTPPGMLALPPSPKLVAANNEPLAGSIPKIMTAALEPAAGKRVELEEAFGAYVGTCQAEGKRAVPPGQFVDPLRKFCKVAGIRIKEEPGQVYLMDVRLAVDTSASGDAKGPNALQRLA